MTAPVRSRQPAGITSILTAQCLSKRPLNRYLTIISEVVEEHGGYVDKFIGDAVMAIWNAPRPKTNHASAAVAAAVKIREDVARAASRSRRGFSVKTGIESGLVTVGNVGSPNRLEFSAIGDVVNLAARLEGANDRFRADILVGPNAAAAVAAEGGPPLLRVAAVQVKGRAAATDIFTPVGADDDATAAAHATALEAFESGDFAGAGARWSSLDFAAAPWSKAMAAIAHELSRAPPPEWGGVIVMNQK